MTNIKSNNIAIIDIGSGNLRSVYQAVRKICDGDVSIIDNAQDLAKSNRIILPGQGAFAQCLNNLRKNSELLDVLNDVVLRQARPFLGICVGMQMLADFGFEHETTAGLGWLGGECRSMDEASKNGLNLPHMGWNLITPERDHPIFADHNAMHMYFANTYHYAPADKADVLAQYDYGARYCAMVGRDNILGVQFHPEKSHHAGLGLLKNFCNWL